MSLRPAHWLLLISWLAVPQPSIVQMTAARAVPAARSRSNQTETVALCWLQLAPQQITAASCSTATASQPASPAEPPSHAHWCGYCSWALLGSGRPGHSSVSHCVTVNLSHTNYADIFTSTAQRNGAQLEKSREKSRETRRRSNLSTSGKLAEKVRARQIRNSTFWDW